MKNRPKPRIRPVDYHLECCIEAGFWKIASIGRSPWSNEKFILRPDFEESSSPGEFHPQGFTDPDVTVSRHPALIIQLPSPATLPYPLAPPISG